MGGRSWCGALLSGALLAAACGDDLPELSEARLWCTVPVSHPSVQAAVDDPVCRTVWIEAGLYDENLFIERSINLEAKGEVVIDGGARGPVVVIDGFGVSATLVDLVIQNGFAERGGGIAHTASRAVILSGTTVRDNRATIVGGGIHSIGRVELGAGSVVERNSVTHEQDGCGGGGINAEQVILSEGSRVSDNRVECSTATAGGIRATEISVRDGSEVTRNEVVAASANGGAIACWDTFGDPSGVYVRDGSVTDNRAIATGEAAVARGGGISSPGCRVTLERATVSGNTALAGPGAEGVARGGGIDAGTGQYQVSRVQVIDSLVSDNQVVADGDATEARGGGIANEGEILLVNSTVSGNRATGAAARGGGVAGFTVEECEPGDVNLYSSTLVDNQAGLRGGGIATNAAVLAAGSIVWGNAAPAAPNLRCAEGASLGYNLFGPLAGCPLAVATDRVGADPLLGELADNGGPTLSHLPREGSPAVDGGHPAGCLGPDDAPLASDQRGMPRPVGVCDVGAVEVQPGR